MNRPTKRHGEFVTQLQEKSVDVLNEPIPPQLSALVEKLRERDRAEQEAKKTDN